MSAKIPPNIPPSNDRLDAKYETLRKNYNQLIAVVEQQAREIENLKKERRTSNDRAI